MRFIAFDLETTGFLPDQHRICEIGALLFDGAKVQAEFSTLIDPECPMPQEASRVNGITDDMLRGKPKVEKVLRAFAEFCSGHLLVAHNAGFDFQFLEHNIRRYESPAPKGVVLDTLALARKILPGLSNYKLGTLVQHVGIKTQRFHRASDDANYCGQLFWHLLQKIQTPNQGNAEYLGQLSGKPALSFPQITPRPKQLALI